MKSRQTRWLGVGALLLLIGILFWKWAAPSQIDEQAGHQDSVGKFRSSERDDTHLPRTRPDLPLPINNDPDSVEAKHFRNFCLRPIAFGDRTGNAPLSLQECLGLLENAYLSIARETNEEPLALHVDLSAANMTKGLRFRTPRASVRMNLQLLAALSGNRLVGMGPNFRFEAIPQDIEPVSGMVRLGPVIRMPDFGSALDGNGAEALSGFDKPPIPPSSQTSLNELFNALGVPLSPDLETAIKGIQNGQTEVSGLSVPDLEILKAVMAISNFDTQVTTTSKVVKLPADAPPPVGTGPISEGALQVLMRELASRPGVNIEGYPTIIARPGELGSINILQGEPEDLHGVQIGYQTHHLGSGEESYVAMRSSSGPEHDPSGNIPRKITLNARSGGKPGHSQILTGTDSEGATVMLIHTHTRLDPTGVIITPTLPIR